LEVDRATIAVTDVGQGPALLFVHTGVWSFIWRDVIARLSRDFRCVCLDAPGTGQSSRLPGRAITLERSARAVTAVIEALDLRDFTLVVHDLGGPTGLAGAAQAPERVRGIVAVNAFGWRPTGAFFRGMLALMGSAPMRELDVLTEFLTRITSTNFGIGRHMDGPSRQAFRAGIDRQGRRAFHYYLRDARNCDALYKDVERALSGPFKGLPLITIFGERNDPLGFQPRWKALFPDAQQVAVTGGNHFPMCDDPDLVADTIRSWHRERVAVSSRQPICLVVFGGPGKTGQSEAQDTNAASAGML
jgi:pimeloyl-ACP methyl ester carboxylesterase